MRVLVVEDQALLREGLARLFADGGHDVVGTLGSAEHLQQLVDDEQPDLVVIDVRMPPTFTDEGARAAREIKERHPGIAVLVLSQHVETTHAMKLATLGGFGYLLKDRVLDVADFLAAATRVAAGGSALDPEVVAGLVAGANDGPLARLSERERDVLALVAEGLSNVAVATRLSLSERTVEAHVRHILTKLDIADGQDGHRRVLAVLAYLNGARERDGERR
ncbi:MAG: response regulator transcription factor [Pseudonocardiales bacterium]